MRLKSGFQLFIYFLVLSENKGYIFIMALLDIETLNESTSKYKSPFSKQHFKDFEEMETFFDSLNELDYHKTSRDDICTPMRCVKTMLDYIPEDFWKGNIKVLDPCAGNGNFCAYASTKTSLDNIYFNELNYIRFCNAKAIFEPKHISNADFFDMIDDFLIKYDLIMANPPYSGGGNKNQSLSNLFIEKSISLLNDGGYLCFITPNNWMTYNTNNTTLKALLSQGSFLVIDNDAKKYFSGVGSSFTIIVWQKGVFNNKTLVKNNFLVKDTKEGIQIPANLKFVPLYISQPVLNIINKCIGEERNLFDYRCDLHNFTKKDCLSDFQDEVFKFPTIHTARKTRYATFKQDIFDKHVIIVPLSTYYIPYIVSHFNVTQSVGYVAFDSKEDAEAYRDLMTLPHFKVIIHLTRYGNFNNIMVLRHLQFSKKISFTKEEMKEIDYLSGKIKY